VVYQNRAVATTLRDTTGTTTLYAQWESSAAVPEIEKIEVTQGAVATILTVTVKGQNVEGDTVYAPDGGVLSYQWYRAGGQNEVGAVGSWFTGDTVGSGNILTGTNATSPSLHVIYNTTRGYRVVVTNTLSYATYPATANSADIEGLGDTYLTAGVGTDTSGWRIQVNATAGADHLPPTAEMPKTFTAKEG
jgi:hypothetical protein